MIHLTFEFKDSCQRAKLLLLQLNGQSAEVNYLLEFLFGYQTASGELPPLSGLAWRRP